MICLYASDSTQVQSLSKVIVRAKNKTSRFPGLVAMQILSIQMCARPTDKITVPICPKIT